MLLQVHDELVFEVPDAEVRNARSLPVIKAVMEDAPLPAVSLSVPLQVEAHAADNWDARIEIRSTVLSARNFETHKRGSR
jgi:DNA polymerase-1